MEFARVVDLMAAWVSNPQHKLALPSTEWLPEHGESQTPLPEQPTVVDITPELARDWLLRNKQNRGLRPGLLRFLHREIVEGRWMVNGQTISFKTDGTLNDGQHRLWAIALGGETCKALVVPGIEPKAFATVDTGRVRQAMDVLAIEGYSATRELAAAIRWAILVDRGVVRFDSGKRTSEAMSNEEILSYVQERPAMYEAAKVFMKRRFKILRLMAPSIAIYSLYRMHQIDGQRAEVFFERLLQGNIASEKDPLLQLRNRLIDNKLSARKMPLQMQLGYLTKAWNAWIRNEKVTQLSIKSFELFRDFEKPEGDYQGDVVTGLRKAPRKRYGDEKMKVKRIGDYSNHRVAKPAHVSHTKRHKKAAAA